MKTIPLTQGKVALVDDADFESVSQFKWTAKQSGKNWYAVRGIGGRKNPTRLWIHRVILSAPAGIEVNHKNGNGLDNRRENLELCTRKGNVRAFRAKATGKTSRFRGVYWYARDSVWVAQVEAARKRYWGGRHQSEIRAAQARDELARHLGFPEAGMNFPQ